MLEAVSDNRDEMWVSRVNELSLWELLKSLLINVDPFAVSLLLLLFLILTWLSLLSP